VVSRWTLETLVLELASEARVDADKMTAIVGFSPGVLRIQMGLFHESPS